MEMKFFFFLIVNITFEPKILPASAGKHDSIAPSHAIIMPYNIRYPMKFALMYETVDAQTRFMTIIIININLNPCLSIRFAQKIREHPLQTDPIDPMIVN